jgi:hypothetical protein
MKMMDTTEEVISNASSHDDISESDAESYGTDTGTPSSASSQAPSNPSDRSDARLIRGSKFSVIVFLIIITTACAALTFVFLSRGQEANFENQVSLSYCRVVSESRKIPLNNFRLLCHLVSKLCQRNRSSLDYQFRKYLCDNRQYGNYYFQLRPRYK